MILQCVAAFLGMISFAILFHVPREQYIVSGVCGMVSWICYFLVDTFYPDPVLASFLAVLMLSILSRIFSIHRKTPILIFLICGIFPLVPGAGIYYTAYHLIMGENQLALDKGIETFKIAIAIALGIALILSFPASFFGGKSHKKEKKV